MSRPNNFEGAVKQWLDDALSLGDERLINAVLPLSGKPNKVEEYHLYKHIKNGNVKALSFMLETFSTSLSSQSLRQLTCDNFTQDEKHGIAMRCEVLETLATHGIKQVFKRINRVNKDTSLSKVMNHRAIARRGEHLVFAGSFLSLAQGCVDITLNDMLTLVELPQYALSDEERKQYVDFFTKWLPHISDLSNDGVLSSSAVNILELVTNLGSSKLAKLCHPLIVKNDGGNLVRKPVVKVTTLSDIPFLRTLMKTYEAVDFNIESKAFVEIDIYLHKQSASDIAWMLLSNNSDAQSAQLANRLYSIAHSVSTGCHYDAHLTKLSFVVAQLAKKLPREQQDTLSTVFASSIERNVAIEEGGKFVNTLVVIGRSMLSNFSSVSVRLSPLIGLLAVAYANDVPSFHDGDVDAAMTYENINTSQNVMAMIGRSQNPHIRDTLHHYPVLLSLWRAKLPYPELNEADVLKRILRKELDVEAKSLLMLMSVNSVISHISKTKSASQRAVLMSFHQWQGIDVINMASEEGIALSNDAKVWLMRDIS